MDAGSPTVNPKNTIEGIIEHKPVKGNPTFCYGLLLWIYDQDEFFAFISGYGKGLNTRGKHKWRQIMRTSVSTIQGFCRYFNITLKNHNPETDELPF